MATISAEAVPVSQEQQAREFGAATATGCLTFLGGAAIAALRIVIYGYTLAKLWSWLVMPVWQAMPRLGTARGIALCVFASFLLPVSEFKSPTAKDALVPIGKAAFFLAIGIIVRRFV